MLFNKLEQEMEKGIHGHSVIIPPHIKKLSWYMDIAKNTMYVVGGFTGSGKSSFTIDTFILGPIQWYMENKNQEHIKLSIVYYGMERSWHMYLAKIISRLIFQERGIDISFKKIIGRRKGLSPEEHAIVMSYKEMFDWLYEEDVLQVFEGSINPTGISKYMEEFARKHGEIEEIPNPKNPKYTTKVYKPTHDNHVVLFIIDHISILAKEKGEDGQKKAGIDKMVASCRYARDVYGFSPVLVQQFNSEISNPMRLKAGNVSPNIEDFKDSKDSTDAADVVLGIFDPWRYRVDDVCGYDLDKLRGKIHENGVPTDRTGKFYRSLHILKNSFDSDGLSIPLAFQPVHGIFLDVPKKAEDMDDADYDEIISNDYFLK
jgi:hypothetical protein